MTRFLACLLLMALCLTGAGAEEKVSYEYIWDYGVENAVVVKREGRYGLMDTTGREIFPCAWVGVNPARDGLLPVAYERGSWGVIDLAGNTVLPFRWDGVRILGNGSYAVREGNLFGLLDAAGQQVIPCDYRSIRWLGEDMYEVSVSGEGRALYALYRGGVQLTDFCWSYVSGSFCHDRIIVLDLQERTVVLNGRGEAVFTLECMSERLCTEAELIQAFYSEAQGGGVQFFDLNGDPVGPRWDNAGDFHDGLARVYRDGKAGFLDKQGELALPLVYDGAWEFSEGMALVRQEGERFWIDTHGNRGADWDYTAGDGYQRCVSLAVDEAGRNGLIDRTGAEVTPCQWLRICEGVKDTPFTSGSLAWAVSQEGAGLITQEGRIVTGDRLFSWLDDMLVFKGEFAFVLQKDTGEVTIWNADGQVY